jgi:hypothetical protein
MMQIIDLNDLEWREIRDAADRKTMFSAEVRTPLDVQGHLVGVSLTFCVSDDGVAMLSKIAGVHCACGDHDMLRAIFANMIQRICGGLGMDQSETLQ